MRNGTQEELDAARKDATKLPFDAVFEVIDGDPEFHVNGSHVYRKNVTEYCDKGSVAMWVLGHMDHWFYCPSRLGVIHD